MAGGGGGCLTGATPREDSRDKARCVSLGAALDLGFLRLALPVMRLH
jgi:hypothetical protein